MCVCVQIVAGSGVATLARLKWDPSTYLIFRGFLPEVYLVLSSVLCFASFMMIALAHLAVVAMGIQSPEFQGRRRVLFLMVSTLTSSEIRNIFSVFPYYLVHLAIAGRVTAAQFVSHSV